MQTTRPHRPEEPLAPFYSLPLVISHFDPTHLADALSPLGYRTCQLRNLAARVCLHACNPAIAEAVHEIFMTEPDLGDERDSAMLAMLERMSRRAGLPTLPGDVAPPDDPAPRSLEGDQTHDRC